jgi:hypothetical protein
VPVETSFHAHIMAIEMPVEREPPLIVVNPLRFSSHDRITHYENLHRQNIALNRELNLMQPEVIQKINVDGPFRLVAIGDTHIGTRFTNIDEVKRMIEPLEHDNVFGFVTGDFIEAQNPHISEQTGSVLVDTGRQIVLAADYLRPYFYAGKLLCTVNGFFGHDGDWSLRWGGIPAVEAMVRYMPLPDAKDPLDVDQWRYLPILEQGGLLRLQLKNGREYTIRIFHDPNRGGSDNINRYGGLKNQFMDDFDYDIMRGTQVDMYIAGHEHHRGVIAKEMYIDRKDRVEKTVVFAQIGSAKGVDDENKDPFLTAQGKGVSIRPGPVIYIDQSRGSGNGEVESTKELVAWGYENAGTIEKTAKMLHLVRDRLNNTERQHLTKELLEKVIERTKRKWPKAEFDESGSRRETKEKPGKAPLYTDVHWNINGVHSIPIMVTVLANIRYGSSSQEAPVYKKKYDEILQQTVKNPFRYVIAGREFLDRGVPKSAKREVILKKMTDELSPLKEHKSLLGIMMSEVLLQDGWERDAGKSKGFRPSDELYYKSALAGVPLFENDAFVTIYLDGVEYIFQILSRLGNSGSEFYLGQGLVQARRKEHTNPDVVAGGHMQLTGSMIYPPKPMVFLPTGHLSAYMGGGTKGNKRNVVTGGQAAIIFPDKKFVWPQANAYEAADDFNALVLDAGLTDDEKKRIARRSR